MGTPPVMPLSHWMPPMMGGPFGRHAAMWLFHSESERIRKECTKHLLDLSDNQYYSEEKSLYISCSIPAQIQTIMGHHQGDRRLNLVTPLVIILHPLTQQMFSAGTHMEEENVLFYMDIDFLVKRPDQQKAGKPERDDKTISSK